jgi:hypothetical protein
MTQLRLRVFLALVTLGLAAHALASCADPAGPPTGVVCEGLRCVCPRTLPLDCNGACTASNNNNCGACGTVCPTGQRCEATGSSDGGISYACR